MSKPDYTYIAVTRQLKGFRVDRFELGLYCEIEKTNLPRLWNVTQILKSLSWLKKMNFEGRNIFIRPEGSQGMIFFDDLNRSQIEELNLAGFEPAILIQSSPYNFHGWIRVSNKPIEPDLATHIAKKIAQDFGGDKDSADWRHFGRLAGFTNQKHKHKQRNGKQPFVKLESYRGQICTRAQELLNYAYKTRSRLEITTLSPQNRTVIDDLSNPEGYYLSKLRGLEARYGANMDNSRADWMIVKSMILEGYSDDLIAQTLTNNSPALDKRKDHIHQYVEITLNNAKKAFIEE